MKKKLWFLFAAVLALACALSLSACGDENDEENPPYEIKYQLDFELSEDESYYIVESYGLNYATEIVIPSEYEGLPVKAIDSHAFDSERANKITSVTIPDSVTEIGKYAFSGCSSLKTLTIGKGLEVIGESAFRNCNALTSVTLPDSVKQIDNYAFELCEALTTVNLPAGLEKMGKNIFRGSKHFIGDGATQIDGVYFIYNATGAWVYNVASTVTDANLPDNTLGIADCAFSNCDELVTVEIPAGVKYIGTDAFADCESLTTVNYGSTAENYEKIYILSGNTPLITANKNYA